MIPLGSYLAFLGVSLLVICTPGPDTALTIRNTLAGGRRSGVATALALRLAGAAYLVHLGIRTLVTREEPTAGPPRTRHAFAQGLLTNLSNAKMVAFFLSLLPPFAGRHPTFGLLLALGLNFCLLTLAWLIGYALAVDRIGVGCAGPASPARSTPCWARC